MTSPPSLSVHSHGKCNKSARLMKKL